MPEALNAVIYARYSSDRQTEQSIEGQLRECYAFAKANDIAVIDTYIDRAISGKTDNRPAFQKMIEDSAKRQFQAVIVYRLDRFTRNRYDSAIYKARLKKNGVKVLSAMENLNGSPESIIMESLLEGMAEYYSVELSQKITRGMRENALTYNYSGENNTATISDLDLSSPPLQSNPNIFVTLDVFGLVVQIER